MKLAIFGKQFDNKAAPFVKQLIEELDKRNIEMLVWKPFAQKLSENGIEANYSLFSKHSDIRDAVDYLISIGGDGTILDSTVVVRDSGIPVVGINIGRLGFLANIAKEEIAMAIEALINKNYRIDERTLLNVKTNPDIGLKLDFALNEVTVSRKDTTSMVTAHAYINDIYLNSYWADGLIIATPTGSTGYSLSCGGPIIMPGSQNFVITPIAPHNLNVRPFVISDEHQLKLKVEGRENQFLLSLDSRINTIDSSVEILVQKENFKIKLVQINDQDFPTTLRNKLHWGYDKRN